MFAEMQIHRHHHQERRTELSAPLILLKGLQVLPRRGTPRPSPRPRSVTPYDD